MIKNIITGKFTTILGLIALIYTAKFFNDMIYGNAEPNFVIAGTSFLISLFLILSSDKWVKTILNKIVGEKFLSEDD